MLEKLLAEIRSGGTFETGELAARLGTTPELLNAMLDHLLRTGYIRPFSSCNDACGGCSLGKTCRRSQSGDAADKSPRLFTLTEA
jgi:hypothetical protein